MLKQITRTQVWLVVLMIGLSLASSACANRWREVNSGRSSAEVSLYLTDALGVSAQSNESAFVENLMADPSRLTYFTEDSPTMGPIHTIMPIDFFALTGQIYYEDIDRAKAFFITRRSAVGGFEGALVFYFQLKGQQGYNTQIFINDAASGVTSPGQILNDDDFQMVLVNPTTGKQITVYSDDLNSNKDDLGLHIQLQVYDEERFLGKVSTLEGF